MQDAQTAERIRRHVSGVAAGDGRADATAVGGRRGRATLAAAASRVAARHRAVADHDRRRAAGTARPRRRRATRRPARGSAAPAAGGSPLTQTDPALLAGLEALVDPTTRGDPQSPLRWTCKSTRNLAEALDPAGASRQPPDRGRAAAARPGYSLQANRKTREGSGPPRPRRPVRAHQRARCAALAAAGPAGRLGGHEEEGVGRGFQERRPGVAARGAARRRCASTTSRTRTLGKAIPYGVYDLPERPGLGQRRHRPRHGRVRRRTASAAGGSEMGRRRYPGRRRAADHGRRRAGATGRGRGSGRWRCRSWPTSWA